MDISPTLTGPLPAAQQPAGKAASKISSDFETFLRMLTVQMQNQDPLNPINSEDFAVQLATFSGVEQQVRTNDLLESLRSGLGAGGMAQAAGWVGMEARVPGTGYFDGKPVTVYPKPQAGADAAVLVVTDAAGHEVDRQAIGRTGAAVDWAGAGAPHGAYGFAVESYARGALIGTGPAEVYTPVTEVRVEGGVTVAILRGGASVATAEITGLRMPPT